METKLKIDKKTECFKLTLPDNHSCVIVCVNLVTGLKPICLELANNIKVDFINKLIQGPDVTQVTLIPVNFNNYIHVFKEWKPI